MVVVDEVSYLWLSKDFHYRKSYKSIKSWQNPAYLTEEVMGLCLLSLWKAFFIQEISFFGVKRGACMLMLQNREEHSTQIKKEKRPRRTACIDAAHLNRYKTGAFQPHPSSESAIFLITFHTQHKSSSKTMPLCIVWCFKMLTYYDILYHGSVEYIQWTQDFAYSGI